MTARKKAPAKKKPAAKKKAAPKKAPPRAAENPDPVPKTPSYPVAAIAKLLLLTERRVQQLHKEGIIPRSDRGRYELVPSVQGYIRYLQDRAVPQGMSTGDLHEEKARLTRAQADIAELGLRERAGELVQADEAVLAWEQMLTNCKNKLLSIPSKAAPILAAEGDPAVVQNEIDDFIREALDELQAGESLGVIQPPGAQAAGEADGQPVG